jgi:hypothetical protein
LEKETEILARARLLFNTAHKIQADCNTLIELTKNEKEVELIAYHAAGIMVSSKYIVNPFKIFTVFNKGKAALEDLISENFEAVELRYLRYTIQLNTPKIAGYSKNIADDRKILIEYIKANRDSDLTKHMMVFIDDTKDAIQKEI